jgi:hypothetical protein
MTGARFRAADLSTPRELHVPSGMFVAYRAVDQSMAERALLESN